MRRFLNVNLNVILVFLFLSAIHVPRRRALTSARRPFLNPNDSGEPADGLCAAAADIIGGFTCQEYKVTTDDGYILSVQRIFSSSTAGGVRPPVLLQHGILVDGMTWLMNSAEQSLAMILAGNEYDVWISNARGTRFSTQHSSLNSFKPSYWDWSFADLAAHDLPSVIALVFDETRQQIHYISHSMGTLMALASMCEGNLKNVKSVVMLSPIAFLSNIASLLTRAGAASFLVTGEATQAFGLAKYDPKGLDVANFVNGLCATLDCSNMLTALGGPNCCLNGTTTRNFINNDVQPTSTKNLVHFSQYVRTGVLSKYDYGPLRNIVHYGAAVPPTYDLSKIPTDLPLFMSYGGQDAVSDVKDVQILLGALNKTHDPKKMQLLFIEKYAHVDFIMSTDANKLVYTPILEFFRKHN